jgi:hypothetical protein
MPGNPDKFKYRHLFLPPEFTKKEKYKSISSGGGAKFKLYPRPDKITHHNKLFAQLNFITEQLKTQKEQRTAVGIRGDEGIIVVFKSEPDFKLKYESLDLISSGIELLNVQFIQNVTYATVFIPEDKIKIFFNRLEKYASEKEQYKMLFANIADIKKATIEGLWTDLSIPLPPDGQAMWWEVWLRSGNNREAIARFFRVNAGNTGLRLGQDQIPFPDRTVLLAYGTKEQIAHSIDLLCCIAELRMAKESPEFFVELSRHQQQEWINDALQRIPKPGLKDISVLILDTGINRRHPLIKPFLDENDLHAYDPDWLKHDEEGHGTAMAGLVLYGDLMDAISSTDRMDIPHIIESGKIIRKGGHEHAPELYGAVTSRVISSAEQQAPERKRIISLAIATEDFRDRGKPSSWSAALDNLCSGYGEEGESKRLIIVCAGNTDFNDRIKFPYSNITEGVHDPAQSWNALCVGAFTEKSLIDTKLHPGLYPIAEPGNISPASTTSVKWDRQWPLKPDVVFEGGNWAKAGNSPVGGDPDEIRLLTTNRDFINNYFVTTGDTSAATSQIARMAAILQAQYPDYWPETIRALIIHSAEWTPAMLRQWNLEPLPATTNKGDIENLIRYCGWGVPDVNRALRSAENSLTLVVQRSITPFQNEIRKVTGKPDSKVRSMRDMHIHQIPWPVDILRDLSIEPVELRITLSYFIEPNPGEHGRKRRYNYASYGLRFDINRPTETLEDFRWRINKTVRDMELDKKPNSTSKSDSKDWVLGQDNRHKGSIHSDIWRGTAINLAERQYIGVYPVIGWWRESPKHKCWDNEARYSLVVSISTPAEDVLLYSKIANKIGIEIAV